MHELNFKTMLCNMRFHVIQTFFFFFFWPCHTAREILVPQHGMESTPSAVKAWSLNHWTAQKVPSNNNIEDPTLKR